MATKSTSDGSLANLEANKELVRRSLAVMERGTPEEAAEHWAARDDLGLLLQLGAISIPSDQMTSQEANGRSDQAAFERP